MLPVHVLNKSVFQNWRGNRKKREKRWQLQSHKKSMIRVWWGLYTPGSLSFPSKSWWEHTGHWPRDPDSNCSSFTTCENLWQNRSRLQASVFPSVKWLVWISNFSLCFCEILYLRYMVSLAAQIVKNLPAMQQTQVWSLGQEDPFKKGMATYSCIFCLGNFMDRGTWWGSVHGGHNESDATEQLTFPLLYKSVFYTTD